MLCCCLLALVAACASVNAEELPPAATRKIDFVKDVQPILAAACLKCHGPLLQEGDYRLDSREVALTKGANFAPNIVPSKSADSPLIQFVAGLVDGMQMPSKGKKLTPEQIGILRAWIDQGAEWPAAASVKVEDKLAWWSLQPLRHVPVPAVAAADHPVDRFVLAKLAEQSLNPAPPADRRVLIRRLYFDLIGLPPSPAAIDSFIDDPAPDAYERLVDELLASPQYGERWARHWLDMAHFAETHGNDQDRIREHAWPYRDYLITALNRDKPYGQFVREQVAGDALYPQDPQATVALGFLAAGPWDESSLRDIREDTLDRQIARYLDRDDMLATVLNNVSSLTVQCARCHDHKFDPIPQADYYALQAVFSGVERANRTWDPDPAIAQQRVALLAREKQLSKLDDATRVELLGAAGQQAVAQWEREQGEKPVAWQVLSAATVLTSDGSVLTKQDDSSFLAAGSRPEKDTYTFTSSSPLREVTAVRVEVLIDASLPHQGPGRQDNGNLHLSEIEVFIGDSKVAQPIARAVADFDQEGWGVARAIDGNPTTAWGIYPQVGKSHEAVFEFKEPLKLAPDQTLTVMLKQLHGGGHLIGRPRISLTDAKNPLRINPLPAEITAIMAIDPAKRSVAQRLTIALHQQREQVAKALERLPKPSLIYAAASDFAPDGNLKPPAGPRPIHLLHRGEITQPREEIQPGALRCLPLSPKFELPVSAHESARRAALATWLTERENPLTWRSLVNRVWHYHFGRGIVNTPNDFGRMGALPTHPELLDWLAVEFRDSDQSLKKLHRLLLTSGTYQQSSQAAQMLVGEHLIARNDHAASRDADNQWLWRMQRSRLDAECIRDAVLTASQRLDARMGGPSDRQFDLKPGRHVTPIIDYSLVDLDRASGSRRSIYRFLFRTLPDPFMEALDCPAGDQIMPTRANSVTVQQSLALWNDAFMLRQAEHFAARLERDAPTSVARVTLALQLTLARRPSEQELRKFTSYVDIYGLANFCRLLFNANEFVFIE
ncbi:PSD1 and planctomycete cytochrome C domain-containing protein [Anatilimnocola sp. NA78]|uniref:PSD1 and planctomycete cytochrome C domain-containing protein n=1 Tax=Anatilimnocola sp. NA78 TaxID=3415683 RepID=UPI003CE52A55